MEIDVLELGLIELTEQEASSINGGESAWYWLCYGVSSTARFIAECAASEPIRPSEYR